jgi:hypothetical protein
MQSDAPDRLREVTKYELKKWGEGWDFAHDTPKFLGYGDEAGEYYDTLTEAYRVALHHHDAEHVLARALQVEILDVHYDNVLWHLDEGLGYYDEVVLPELEQVKDRYNRYVEKGVDSDTANRMALDWAQAWGVQSSYRSTSARCRSSHLGNQLPRG